MAGAFACAAMALSLAGTAKPASADSWDLNIRVGGGDRYRHYDRRDRCDDYRYRRDDWRWRDNRYDRWDRYDRRDRCDDWRYRREPHHGNGWGRGGRWR